MSDTNELERRYRRLLAFYPRAYRHEHEREMLTVLMLGAEEGQQRPRWADARDLARNGLRARMRHLGTSSAFVRRHPLLVATIRVLTAMWLFVLTIVLCQIGDWWGLSLLLPMALHLFLAYRIAMAHERRRGEPPPQAPAG